MKPLKTIPADESIPGRFARVAARFAGRPAVSAPAGQWSYAELDHRSDVVAAEILSRRGGVSEPVALLMEHDSPLIAAILGALKAGKMYVVLDPGHPAEQLAARIVRSGAKLLLADRTNLAPANAFAPGNLEIVAVAGDWPGDWPCANFPKIGVDADAWLMFTSGSTSAPKGVWQNHRGIVQEADMYAELIGLAPEDRISLLASCGLAASGATLFATLLNGAALCLFSVRSQGVERLADWLPRESITVFHSVPAIFRHLARAADRKNAFASVRLVRLGGEPVLRGDVEIFRRQCRDDCRLMQSLSSTETGIISTFTMDKRTMLQNLHVPAGRAVCGVEIFLVDENHQPLKAGGGGIIAVRSARLRQGYWRQPELTAEKFLADWRDASFRIFISNDLGRLLPDGTLEHLGRADQLVKIRGQRVELSEVEAALLATELAEDVVVTALEDELGEKSLAAYLVPRAGAKASSQNIRSCLRKQLPEHMIPNAFVVLKKLPLTAGGKIDRCALPLPAAPAAKKSLSRRQRQRDVVDKRLMLIWESALNISPIGRKDDFFELGGTSLQSVEVLLQLEELFGISLPPSTLAEYSTIEKLTALLASHAIIPSPTPLVKLSEGVGRRPLFLIHSGQGDVTSYGLLTRRLPHRPIYGLQSVGMQGESWPLMSVPAMARRYLPEILAQDPTGPYLIAGTCMGGMVALELAQMLVQQQQKVGLLCLLDTGLPMPDSKPSKWRRRIYVSLRAPLHEARRRLRWKFIRAIGLGRHRRLLPEYRRLVVHFNVRANQSYHPCFYPGELTLIITTDTKFANEDPRMMLRQFARSTRLVAIPGQRQDLFKQPAVVELARQLETCMESAEK